LQSEAKSVFKNLSTIHMAIRNVVIMGSGCAGHTAALYAARANLKPLVIEGHEPGGQLSMTTLVENFPGFPEGIQGPELIENMRKQASRFGAEYHVGHVVKADLSKRPFALSLGKETIQARTLIIASGASARWLGLPTEFHPALSATVSSSPAKKLPSSEVGTPPWKKRRF